MSTISEMTAACKKLRTRKAPLRFRPMLIYLVETVGGYVHPDVVGYHGGQTVWMDQRLHFRLYGDARDHAATYPSWQKPRVVKLNVVAFEEAIVRNTS